MAISPALNSMSGITHAIAMPMDEDKLNLSDLDKKSFSELPIVTLCGHGESSSTIAANMESTAPSSAMKHRTGIKAVSLLDKLTPSLISSGLVRGITPMSIRKRSGARILDTALSALDGNVAAKQKAV